MGLRLNKRSDSPPDWFRFTVPETGHVIRSLDVDTWMLEIKNYYRVNSIPVPDNLREIAEDQVCQLLPPGWCHYSDGGAPADYIDTRLGIDDVLRGTAVVSEIIARRIAAVLSPDWSPFVTQEEAEARAATCAACYVKVPVQGCLSCREFSGAVGAVIGNRKTKSDPQLEFHSCAICKCSAKAHVWVKGEVLGIGMSDEMLASFDKIPHCWKAQAIREARLTSENEQSSPAP